MNGNKYLLATAKDWTDFVVGQEGLFKNCLHNACKLINLKTILPPQAPDHEGRTSAGIGAACDCRCCR